MSNIVDVGFFHILLSSGEPLIVAQLNIEPDWHVYWENPGESGYATEINAECVTKTIYPPPHKFIMPGDIINYGYEGKAWIFATGNCELGTDVTVSWLSCQDDTCLPGKATGALKSLPEAHRSSVLKLWAQSTETTPVQVLDGAWSISIKTFASSDIEYYPSTSLEKQSLTVQVSKTIWTQEWVLTGKDFGKDDQVVVRIKKRDKERIVIYTAQE